jgi:DNA replication and repair protein RecF
MLLENLHLDNFKNYSNCSFSFSPDLNFIFGENGNGKTNVLEAISLLCYSKSFLLNSEADCVKYGANCFSVTGQFKNAIDISQTVRFRYNKDENNKELYFGTEKVTRFNEFIGNFPLVVLSPQDLKLTTGTPHDRRRNFDLLISQVSRVYLDDVRNYNRVIRQKNSLLKSNLLNRKYSGTELKGFIEVWNEELVLFAVKILIRRLDFLEDFKKYLAECFNRIVGERYIPVISYESDVFGVMDKEFMENEFSDIPKIREHLRLSINEKMDAEIKRGISLAGPHRDNYIFTMEKEGQMFDVRTFASQGEHKTFVVSLKLSEFGYIRSTLEHTGIGEPVLLLDDVFSELDKSRIAKIGALITSYNQVFITTTDYDYLEMLKNNFNEIRSYQIINGSASLVN